MAGAALQVRDAMGVGTSRGGGGRAADRLGWGGGIDLTRFW